MRILSNTMYTILLTDCADSRKVIITTEYREHYQIVSCPHSEGSHMKAVSKTILFAAVTHDRKRHQWPVGVFANTDSARSFATFLRLAYRAKDVDSIAALDKNHAKDADGVPLFDTKWSMVTVPYEPTMELGDDDTAATDETPTS